MYKRQNADGTLTITVNTLTYFTGITVGTKVPYAENIYVGADKEYKTINDALAAVRDVYKRQVLRHRLS